MPSTALDTANNLTTLDEAKVFLNITTSATSEDRRVRGLIDAVSHEVNALTGRRLKRRTLTEFYDGPGTHRLYLNEYPVQDTTGIDVRVISGRDNYQTTTEFTTDLQVKTSELAVYSSAGRIEWTEDVFDRGTRNVRIVYDAGYDVTASSTTASAIPADLRNAVHEMIAHRYFRNRRQSIGMRSVTQGAGSEVYIDDLPPSVQAVIDRYRDW